MNSLRDRRRLYWPESRLTTGLKPAHLHKAEPNPEARMTLASRLAACKTLARKRASKRERAATRHRP